MRLLLLEDDRMLGEGLRDFLLAEGHMVDWCERLADARALWDSGVPFDALLLDWRLPDGSGLDWLRELRKAGGTTPTIMMTARDTLADRVTGLDSGADDYLVKPFAPEELAARVRAATRRTSGAAAPRMQFGDVEVDLTARAAFLNGERANLTAREWALLEALVLRAGRIVPREELEKIVHGANAELASNALGVHLSNLRGKLGHDLVVTVRGLGFRING